MLFLRGHHLICLQFFSGEGYNREFIDNLGKIITRTEKETIKITSGPDDVCAACPSLKDSACGYKDGAEEEINYLDSTALDLLLRSPGDTINSEDIRKLVPSIFKRWYIMICRECGWLGACNKNIQFLELRKLSFCDK